MNDNPKSTMREAWILFMILGMCMINFPFIHIFDGNRTVFGIPQLVLYFMIGWPASIAVIRLFVYLLDHDTTNHNHSRDGGNS